MKDETLRKFTEDYKTYVKAASSEFKEIKELEDDLEKDPRTIQLKKLQEELAKDPKTLRLEKLKAIKRDLEERKKDVGHWNYRPEDYAYFSTRPKIEKEDTYGILVRFGPYKQDKIHTYRETNSNYYVYLDVENYENRFEMSEEDIEEFEKNHQVIYAPSDNEYIITKEFLVKCTEVSPEEAAKELMKKYNTKKEDN